MLGKPISFYPKEIAVFAGDLNKPQYSSHIFILSPEYSEDYVENMFYEDVYPVEDKYMFVFNVPMRFEPDYDKFLRGDYSQFSLSYKQTLIALVPSSTNIRKIVYPQESDFKELEQKIGQRLHKKEIYSSPDTEEEYYGI